MGKFSALDVIFWAIVLAIVFMLVRPGSKAAAGLIAVTDAFAAVVGTATGAVARGG